MTILSGISQTFSSFAMPLEPVLQRRYPKSDHSDTPERRLNKAPLSPSAKTSDWLKTSTIDEDFEVLEGDTLLTDALRSRKRSTPSSEAEPRPAKRQKSNDGYQLGSDDEGTDFEGDTLLGSTPVPGISVRAYNKAQEDRQAMPPPMKPAARLDDRPYTPSRGAIDRSIQSNILGRQSFEDDAELSEDEIFTRKTAVRREDRSEVNPQFEYDRALRHAQAQQLPEDASTWAEAEKDLFYRLAMRGFEPLLPGHWTMDFKTLPGFLFASANQKPLILPFDEREFRAKHYLRNLFSIAAKARDRRLAGLRAEPSIKRILRQYICWALLDAGVHPSQRPKVIPVHAMVAMRRGESTQDVIRRMSKRLYKLARRYQDLHRVRPSIEPTSQTYHKPSSGLDCSLEYDDPHMPTLIGLMIVSSVVVVVTLDSRSQPHKSPPREKDSVPEQEYLRSFPSTSPSLGSRIAEESSTIATIKDDFGLRFIANFDFSTQDGYDVWDGFAMAICIMRIRKTMLELYERAEREGQAGKDGVWERIWPDRGVRVTE